MSESPCPWPLISLTAQERVGLISVLFQTARAELCTPSSDFSLLFKVLAPWLPLSLCSLKTRKVYTLSSARPAFLCPEQCSLRVAYSICPSPGPVWVLKSHLRRTSPALLYWPSGPFVVFQSCQTFVLAALPKSSFSLPLSPLPTYLLLSPSFGSLLTLPWHGRSPLHHPQNPHGPMTALSQFSISSLDAHPTGCSLVPDSSNSNYDQLLLTIYYIPGTMVQ